MEPIITLTEKCRKCYSCVRSCPVKAIKVEKTFTEIIFERCIGCGNCLSNCPQHAKVVTDKVGVVENLLAGEEPVIAVLGCSFPAFFHTFSAGQLAAGLKKLGFAEVHEGAAGVELIAAGYAEAMEKSSEVLISSHCPAIVDLIERHYPTLIKNLVRVISPMVAIGRFLKTAYGPEVKVVYLSSCIAAKFEIQAEETQGAIDMVLTYREMEEIFLKRGILPALLAEDAFDGLEPHLGRLFPIAEGTFKAFSIATDPLDTEIVTAAGEVNAMGIIKDLAAGRINPRIVDIRFCYDGCIGGPGKKSELTEFYKRNLIIAHFKNDAPYRTASHYQGEQKQISLTRSFTGKYVRLKVPKGSDVKKILHATNKFTQKDELNCRACGYRTCREYAVAVYQGLADLEMCLPHTLQQLVEDRGRLIEKYELARRELDREYGDEFIVGDDGGTIEVLDLIKQVGPTPTTVLIRGESGTGKELTARAIHRYSKRNDKPLVTVNCTTITDSLLESELFGHKKGAFTGAIIDKKGLFEAADGGTIFLDEIGDITPKLQAELLRVLDSGEVRPVGGTTSRKVDVRLIAATNKELETGVRDGWFREDLYYRLNVFAITMPPLRSRVESIPLLAHHFLEKARNKLNKSIIGLEDRAVKAMMQYSWPGNIREMQNVIERAAVLTHDEIIKLGNLPLVFAENYAEEADDVPDLRSFKLEREPHVMRVEKKLIQRYLADAGGNVSKAAQLANIPRRSFYRLLDKHGLKGRGAD
ncbi:iron-sulfur cluster-binding sigma-54-dependent transcriptional regulator, FehydlgC and FeS domain-containing [Geotalea daltonii FRC-32]|uniref:Iron-sulfur cluster-binding sigma-54-dependent transcriptional regulator, FehydlgC and FeS domain-containing n=1 Tax=Geotalea daltonii (strain DSM 22248 / JCM 15807 / FRC-32) TaxID=316067 RepID=B9LZV2_GEODF|nr:sigma 54-interacting transcriptional regulator [Geotalea daltonii]ACM18916.1 iron-sulfur cluster-binding sigma-54-dependent transcriptional regulator, FehydlgC and FeS domain-containing [Geotalea daltonii FRC-32]